MISGLISDDLWDLIAPLLPPTRTNSRSGALASLIELVYEELYSSFAAAFLGC